MSQDNQEGPQITQATAASTGDGGASTALQVGGSTAAQPAPVSSGNGVETSAQEGQWWGDDWRSKLAGGDEKKADRLKRYTTPDAVVDALIHVQNRISAGELRSILPKNATEEQLKKWREENGIPESPDKYDLKLSDDLVLDEAEMPNLKSFLEIAHKKGMDNTTVKELAKWHFDWVDAVNKQMIEQDRATALDVTGELRQSWGQDYQENMNRIHGLLDMAPAAVRENLMNGRMADGTLIGNSPAVLSWLADRARAEDPSGTLLGTKGGDTLQTVEDRIKQIEEMIRTNRREYNRNVEVQKELRDLYESRATLQRRGA
jgi:hypothetical protein